MAPKVVHSHGRHSPRTDDSYFASTIHQQQRQTNQNEGRASWNERQHANEQSLLLGITNREWMGQPYTYNATPMSWFQRYYRQHPQPSSHTYLQPRRDQNYTSSGTLPDVNIDVDLDENKCLTCVELCCGSFCSLLCCCGCFCRRRKMNTDNPNEAVERRESPVLHRQNSASRYLASCGFCLVFLLTLILPVILLRVSTGDHTWNLRPGESHQISPAFLNKKITVSTNGKVGTRVYALPGHCPPLSGQPLSSSSNNRTIRLQEGEYEYDEFYLNEGSLIDVEITNAIGSVNVYLLEGRNVLEQLEESSFDTDSTYNPYILQERGVSSWSENVTMKQTSDTTDTYVLLYDNVREGTSKISVSYHLNLATYDLLHKSPVCAGGKDHRACTVSLSLVPLFEKQCLLIQAESSPNLDDIVTVRITQHRRYGWIAMISLLPLLAMSIWPCCYRETTRSSPYEHIHDSSGSPPPALSPNYRDYTTLSRKHLSPTTPPVSISYPDSMGVNGDNGHMPT